VHESSPPAEIDMPDGPVTSWNESASPSGSTADAKYWYGWPSAPLVTGALVKYGGLFVCDAPGSAVVSPVTIVLTIDVPMSPSPAGRPFHSAHSHHWLCTAAAPRKFDHGIVP